MVGAATRLNLAGDCTFKDLMIEADSAKLDLTGHQLIVKSPWHAYPTATVLNGGELTEGKRPNWSNITWGGIGFVLIVR